MKKKILITGGTGLLGSSLLDHLSIIFLPQEVKADATAQQAAVAMMPGAFHPGTTLDLFTWVREERYLLDNGEDFQRYHARMVNERRAAKSD